MSSDCLPSYNSILISGKPLSGKSTLVSALSKIYGWEAFSVGKLWREEWKRRYPDGEVSFEEYWGKTTLEENKAMDQKAKEKIEKGHVIGDFRFAHLTSNPNVLKVFVDADISTRMERARSRKEYSSLSKRELRKLLNKREKDEVKMEKSLYGKRYDYRNPLNYHIVINSGSLKLDEEVKIIMGIVNSPTHEQEA